MGLRSGKKQEVFRQPCGFRGGFLVTVLISYARRDVPCISSSRPCSLTSRRAATQQPDWWPKPAWRGRLTALPFVYSAFAGTGGRSRGRGNSLLFLACLGGPGQNKASVYVPWLSPSNPPQAQAPAGPLGALRLGGLRGFPAGPGRPGWSGAPRPPAGLPPAPAGPLNQSQGGGKPSLRSLAGPGRIEDGPINKGWGLSLCSATALWLT